MFKKISELCRCIAVMNNDGLDRLVTFAKDIIGHENLRKPDGELTPTQFNRQVNQVIAMVNRRYEKECGYAET